MMLRPRLHSFAFVATVMLLSACANSTKPAQDDTASVAAAIDAITRAPREDQALSCPEVAAEIIRLEGLNRRAETALQGGRTQDQTARSLAALFPVPLAAVDTNAKQTALLARTQQRQEDLRQLKRAKAC